MRNDGRKIDQLRPIDITLHFIQYPEGSVLIKQGNTQVLCNVTIENTVPRWMQTQNIPGGWVTAEYAMLPRATIQRTSRETNGLTGRTQEIKRLIGRSLRASIDLALLGARTCIIDCDVLMADGGTRTTAITGSYIALELALNQLIRTSQVDAEILKSPVASVSVGILDGEPILDLCYEEDRNADVDLNVVMNAKGEFIEIQGTAETRPFSKSKLDKLLTLAEYGIQELFTIQRQALAL